jgi:hypothetical protein
LTVGDGWHPIAVGTVNPGVYWCVFDTTWLLAAAVDLNDKQQGDLAVQSLDYAFCDATVKKKDQRPPPTTAVFPFSHVYVWLTTGMSISVADKCAGEDNGILSVGGDD